MEAVVLTVPGELWAGLQGDLLSTPELERAAAGFAGIVADGSSTRLLLRDWSPVPADEYLVQLGYHLEVSPVFWARAAKRCRSSREAMIILHSHPGDPSRPRFSPSDDAGEELLVPKLRSRAQVPVGAVVVSSGGATARVTEDARPRPMDVRVAGRSRPQAARRRHETAWDRQIRALGTDGHAVLRDLTVGVVGAGGLGAHVIQQCVHLGVGRIVVVDPDRVTISNLSRLVGGSRWDVRLRRRKTRVGLRLARRVGGSTVVEPVDRSVVTRAAAERLLGCDVIFGCTDNQLSRTLLNALAFQYYVPVIDLGVELQSADAMGGRVVWLTPGGACLWCMGILDPERVRVEQLPEVLRRDEAARGYIRGLEEPAPAVISINGVIASMGVTEMLARFTGFTGSGRRSTLLLYRLTDGVVRPVSPKPRPDCPTCSVSGLLGSGDLAPAPWPS